MTVESYNIGEQLAEWKSNLKTICRTTGKTNYLLLKDNHTFKALFPFVTKSDGMVINMLLKELRKYRL